MNKAGQDHGRVMGRIRVKKKAISDLLKVNVKD